jgi:hypothetical protein
MLQVFKILLGHDNVRTDQWFKMAANSSKRKRMANGLLNLTKLRAKLEALAKFFSVRVVDKGMRFRTRQIWQKNLDRSRGCIKPTGAASVESEMIWRRM